MSSLPPPFPPQDPSRLPPQSYPPPQGYPQPMPPGVPLNYGQVCCPNCGSPSYRALKFTWWGGVLGPKLLSHVECNQCGATFNSKTGQRNTTAIAIYLTVVSVISIVLLLVIFLAMKMK